MSKLPTLDTTAGKAILVAGLAALGYVAVNFGIAAFQNPVRHYIPGRVSSPYQHSRAIPENNYTNPIFAAWRLKPNSHIVLNDAGEGLVLKESAEFDEIREGDFGLCIQVGTLRRSDVEFYYKRTPDGKIERSSEVPRSLDSLFEPDGLCEYRSSNQ